MLTLKNKLVLLKLLWLLLLLGPLLWRALRNLDHQALKLALILRGNLGYVLCLACSFIKSAGFVGSWVEATQPAAGKASWRGWSAWVHPLPSGPRAHLGLACLAQLDAYWWTGGRGRQVCGKGKTGRLEGCSQRPRGLPHSHPARPDILRGSQGLR